MITKPRIDAPQFIQESAIRICDAVKSAARARMRRRKEGGDRTSGSAEADRGRGAAQGPGNAMIQTTEKVVAVGASTGGTEAIRTFLEACRPTRPAW